MLVAVDFEYCVVRDPVEGRRPDVRTEQCEIIQIGAVRLDGDGKEVASLNVLVSAHSVTQLPAWLQKLINVTDAQRREKGVSFADAVAQLRAFCGDAEVWTFSGDWFVLLGDCKAHNVVCPFDKPFLRARALLDRMGITQQLSSGELHTVVGLQPPAVGAAHDALFDARNLAQAVFRLRWAQHTAKQALAAPLTSNALASLILRPPTPKFVPVDGAAYWDFVSKVGGSLKFGLLGLGSMGVGIANNLEKRCAATVARWNRSDKPERNCSSIAEACAGADAVFGMLSNDDATEEVVFGPGGALQSLKPGAIFVNMATLSVKLVQTLDERFRSENKRFVNCPVFGRPDAAAAGLLFLIAGGAHEDLDTLERWGVFAAVGQRAFKFEAPTQSAVVKLCGNFLIANVIEAIGSTFAVGERNSVTPGQLLEVFLGTLFGSPIYSRYGRIMEKREFTPAGFQMRLGLKDVNLFIESCESKGVSVPFATVLRERFTDVLKKHADEDLDWSAVGVLRE